VDRFHAGGESRRPSAAREITREPSWSDYLVFARLRLGISDDEFYRLSPRQFVALWRGWELKEREDLRRIALLRMDVINFSFCRPKKPITLSDLLPGEAQTQRAEPSRPRMTRKLRQEIANSWRAIATVAAPATEAEK
jgi:hypothetical protein